MNYKVLFILFATFVTAFFVGRFSVPKQELPSARHTSAEITTSSPQLVQEVSKVGETSSNLDEKLGGVKRTEDMKILEELEQQNKALTSSYQEREKEWVRRYTQVQSHLTAAQRMLEKQGLELETISHEEVEKVLPAPFAELVSSSSGSTVKNFKELQNQEQDYEWAILMQQRISDFFITHELSNAVTLQAVTCKATICEIRGFQTEKEALRQIMSAMSAQPWWTFQSTHSSTRDSEEFGNYFYILTKTQV